MKALAAFLSLLSLLIVWEESAYSARYSGQGNKDFIFAEVATNYASHYNFAYYDSTPKAAVLAAARLGLNVSIFSLYYEASTSYTKSKASSLAGGVRIHLYHPYKGASMGLSFEELFYKNAGPSKPSETFSSRSTSFRYGLFFQTMLGTKIYSLLSFQAARISSNLFIFPSLGFGLNF